VISQISSSVGVGVSLSVPYPIFVSVFVLHRLSQINVALAPLYCRDEGRTMKLFGK
jgi:hypothetical protein